MVGAQISQLRELLTAGDPDTVYQGVELVGALGDPSLYQALLGDTVVRESTHSLDNVRFQTLRLSAPFQGRKGTRNLQIGAALALAARAPVGCSAAADALREGLERLVFKEEHGPAALWELDGFPNLHTLAIKGGVACAVRMPARLKSLVAVGSDPVPVLVAGGLAAVETLRGLNLTLSLPLSGLAVERLDLDRAPRSLGGLAAVEGLAALRLKIAYADSLTLPALPALRELSLCGRSRLRGLGFLEAVPGLRTLSLRDDTALTDLAGVEALAELESLELALLPALADIPELSGLPLRHLGMRKLPALSAFPGLPDTIRTMVLHGLPFAQMPIAHLSALETLKVSFCQKLRALPALHPDAPVRSIEVIYCNRLASLPTMPTMAQGAEADLNHLPALSDISGFRSSRRLERLRLQDNPRLHTLPLAELEGLTKLNSGNLTVEALSVPPGLARLNLRVHQPETLQALRGHPGLWRLWLSGALTHDGLAPLATLGRLRTLVLNGGPLGTLSGVFGALPGLEQLLLVGDEQRTHLDDLAPLRGLQWLSTSNLSALRDVGGIGGLPALRTVSLSGAGRLRDLSPLASLPALETLSLSQFSELSDIRRDLGGLRGCARLHTLRLSAAVGLRDVSALSELPQLRVLSLEGARDAQDLSPLARLPALETLLLGDPHIQSLSSLSGAPRLRRLSILSSTGRRDLSFLEALPALEELSLAYSRLTEESWELLTRLPGLKRLHLTAAMVKERPAAWRGRLGAALVEMDFRPPWYPQGARL